MILKWLFDWLIVKGAVIIHDEYKQKLNERRTLLSNCDDININIETLLFGNDKYSYDVNSKNLEKFELL